MLDRQHVHLVHVQKIGRAAIRAQVSFSDFESDARGIRMATAGVVHGNDEPSEPGNCSTNASVKSDVVVMVTWRADGGTSKSFRDDHEFGGYLPDVDVLGTRAFRTLSDSERHRLAFPQVVERRGNTGRLMEEILDAFIAGNKPEPFISNAFDGSIHRRH
jgi:hypothetical protein